MNDSIALPDTVLVLAQLGAHIAWVAVLFGQRTLAHVRRTGDSGWRGLGSNAVGHAVKACFAIAAFGFVGGAIRPWLDQSSVSVVAGWQVLLSAALALSGFGLAVSGQAAMGRWWRIGVREGEAVGLVTSGPFRWVRNPIFTGMLTLLLGFVVLQPGALTVVAWGATAFALWLQVAHVEEPHLRRVLGEQYLHWAADRGRFLP